MDMTSIEQAASALMTGLRAYCHEQNMALDNEHRHHGHHESEIAMNVCAHESMVSTTGFLICVRRTTGNSFSASVSVAHALHGDRSAPARFDVSTVNGTPEIAGFATAYSAIRAVADYIVMTVGLKAGRKGGAKSNP